MSDVTLTVYEADRSSGANYTDNKTAGTSANDYYFTNNGKTVLITEAAGGATVTVETVKTVDGEAVADLSLTAGTAKVMVWGPFPPNVYNDGDGEVHVTVSANTSLFVVSL